MKLLRAQASMEAFAINTTLFVVTLGCIAMVVTAAARVSEEPSTREPTPAAQYSRRR